MTSEKLRKALFELIRNVDADQDGQRELHNFFSQLFFWMANNFAPDKAPLSTANSTNVELNNVQKLVQVLGKSEASPQLTFALVKLNIMQRSNSGPFYYNLTPSNKSASAGD